MSGIHPLKNMSQQMPDHEAPHYLLHLPQAYQDKTKLTSLADAVPGEYCYIQGTILSLQIYRQQRSGAIRLCEGPLRQSNMCCQLVFFYGMYWLKKKAQAGNYIRAYGQIQYGKQGWQMVHPEITWDCDPKQFTPAWHCAYRPWQKLSALQVKKTIHLALKNRNALPNWPAIPTENPHFPPSLRHHTNGYDLLDQLHHPQPNTDITALQQHTSPMHFRLAYEELTAYFLTQGACLRRSHLPIPPCDIHHPLVTQLIESLPFQLSGGQMDLLEQLQQWLISKEPLSHLIQGDVGSGKTIIAFILAVACIAQQHQVCMLAPTETLARQLMQKAMHFLSPLKINCALLVGSLPAKDKKKCQQALAEGHIHFLIGTHAVLQPDITFAKLGLCIIDEQHRFGVSQRGKLWQKGGDIHPHLLMMSATPIPRTLAKAVFSELQLLELAEKPASRQPIQTFVFPNAKRQQLLKRCHHWLQQHQQQIYWICPTINPDDENDISSAKACHQQLQTTFVDLNIGLLHGKMPSREQKEIMASFYQGNMPILVATTIVEVGIDVPAANVIVIEDAHRLGLSQLHQLRGRVGRSHHQGYCFLMYEEPLSDVAKTRLQVLRTSEDGFYLADQDLKLRGPGEGLGMKQSGWPKLQIADWHIHGKMIHYAQATAKWLLQNHPQAVEYMINWWYPQTAIHTDHIAD